MWEASPTPIKAYFMGSHPFVTGRSSELRKGRISEDFACYSITKIVNLRRKVLATDSAAGILLNSWQFMRSRNRIKLFAFCIMPDHYHIALCLMPGENLSKVMEDVGKFTSRELNKLLYTQGQFWLEGFHDHRCRDEVELHELCSYIEHNPVRKRAVDRAEQWPFSSANPLKKAMLDREWWP